MLSAGINRHGTGTVDQAILAPTHEDSNEIFGASDDMEMLPLVSFMMFHFERELSFEHLNNFRMLVHLHPIVTLRLLHCSGVKIDRRVGGIARVPINVRCSIFNEILPIRD